MKLTLNKEALSDLLNLSIDTFAPLTGFMNQDDYESVVNHMKLADGHPWTIPVTLEVPENQVEEAKSADLITLVNEEGTEVGTIEASSIYKVNYANDIKKVFKVEDDAHPGVKKERSRSPYRVGGKVTCTLDSKVNRNFFTPAEVKAQIAERGWKTVAGFQTRNPIHRAHEYLQRSALELVDGLFIQPLVGWKRPGDFTPNAVLDSYEKMTTEFYPSNRVVLGTLTTPMRYAGPREAVFHSIIRRNFGCTHFIVGRDHAGVGGFYGKYEAQELCQSVGDLGITILPLAGPFYCGKCESIATEKTCGHNDDAITQISGTQIRSMLNDKEYPPKNMMRPEIAQVLINLQENNNLFIQ